MHDLNLKPWVPQTSTAGVHRRYRLVWTAGHGGGLPAGAPQPAPPLVPLPSRRPAGGFPGRSAARLLPPVRQVAAHRAGRRVLQVRLLEGLGSRV